MMKQRVNQQKKIKRFILIVCFGFIPTISHAIKSMSVTSILANIKPKEPWDRGGFSLDKTVYFQQAASGGTDATSVSMVTLSYFTAADCSGTALGSYTTPPSSAPLTISVGIPFGLVTTSTWAVGTSQVGISSDTMATVGSVATTLYSTTNNTPQANFSSTSFACIPVTCAINACTSSSGTQSFQLKTTPAIGDPADGGVIACMDSTINPPTNAGYLVVPTSDSSTGMHWGSNGTTGAVSVTDGAGNTIDVINTFGAGTTYAVGLCGAHTALGGYTTGWFLPSLNQLTCLYTNNALIPGFNLTQSYWTSTSTEPTTVNHADSLNFSNGSLIQDRRDQSKYVRCARSYTP